jgi:uncharacterized protein YbjT (DUF2867 family)
MGKTALIVGSSGLVGNELLHLLLWGMEYDKVTALVRRPLGVKHPKLEQVICNFDQLEDADNYFNVDDVFSCLGTTIKKAKTKEKMYKIDVEYTLAVATLAQKKEVKHFLYISSMNANIHSSLWYSRMKGKLEEEIKHIPFNILSIFRPSLLLGNRSEFRLGERVAEKLFHILTFLFPSSWKSRVAIEAKLVAEAMYQVAQLDNTGVLTYSSNLIEEIATHSIKNRG